MSVVECKKCGTRMERSTIGRNERMVCPLCMEAEMVGAAAKLEQECGRCGTEMEEFPHGWVCPRCEADDAFDKHRPPDPEWTPPPDLDAMMLFADEGEGEHPLRIAWEKFQGEWGLDIRYQYITDDGYTKPTKRGIRIPRERVEEFILNLMEWITHDA